MPKRVNRMVIVHGLVLFLTVAVSTICAQNADDEMNDAGVVQVSANVPPTPAPPEYEDRVVETTIQSADRFDPPLVATTAACSATPGCCRTSHSCGCKQNWFQRKFRWLRRSKHRCCGHCQAQATDNCRYSGAQPVGLSLHAIIDTQVRQAETAMMVVHRSDFEHNGQRLNRGGLLRLKQISKLLPTNTSRVIVQRTKSKSELDERRRQTVIMYLSDNAVAVPAERIVFGEPRVRGFDGIDAEAAHERMLQLNGAAGTTSTVGSTSAQGKSSPKPGK